LEAEAGRRGNELMTIGSMRANVHIHCSTSDSWLEPGETRIH